jgi:hypothetical protein
MTKPWVMDGRARSSQAYRDMHERLTAETLPEQPKTRAKSANSGPDQMSLFEPVAQPRCAKREPIALYQAVMTLRRRGMAVYRGGRHGHIVSGKIVTDAQLVAIAEQVRGMA